MLLQTEHVSFLLHYIALAVTSSVGMQEKYIYSGTFVLSYIYRT